jgi:replicative DNA helicase
VYDDHPDVPEHDEFESALIGAVLDGYRDVPALTRIVAPSDFRQSFHEAIWVAILAVHERGDLPTALTVMHQMGNRAHTMLPGGATYLTSLHNPGVGEQATFYAARVREQSIRRQIEGLGKRCVQLVGDLDRTPQEMLEEITAWAQQVEAYGGSEPQTMGAALEVVVDIAEHGEAAALSTPWPELSAVIDGWYPGQYITIASRPGVGKSIALENIATDIARTHKLPVLFISLEMSAAEITQRTLANTAGVPLRHLRSGSVTEDEWNRINRCIPIIQGTPVEVIDQGHQTMASIRSSAMAAVQRAKRNGTRLGAVIVDYLQLVTPRDTKINRQQQVGEMTRAFKLLAKELQTPVIVAAQLNRQPTGRANGLPVLSDLRESGDIEQDSDVVIFLHEEFLEVDGRLEATGEIKVIIAKQRSGPLGTRVLRKYGAYSRLAS